MIRTYLKRIFEIASRGDDREESYYSTLESLFEEYANLAGKLHIKLTTLPKKTEAGNPDFRVWDGKQHIVGYIEAKAPTAKSLDDIEDSEQLKRYIHTFPNIILTNFFEFRLYRNGSLIDSAQIARSFWVHKGKTVPPAENEDKFFALLEKFFSFSLPKVYKAKELALELAKRTRFLRDEVVTQELKEEAEPGTDYILGFYEAFRKYLISGLSKEDFADLYSQTITYGLFAARTRSENGFNRKLAYDNIPQTIGILRDVFKFISLGNPPPQMEWIIDDISEVLAVTDVGKILHDYFHEGKGKDPIVHFYETFLAEYDPKTREKRGVYYTPEPVVSYIVRSLHQILKDHFGRADGLASETVMVLDPAAGTLTFLAEAAKIAAEEFIAKYGEGGKADFIRDHILKNFYAFELMMAPYAIGHLKMSFLLEELGYKLQKDDRFKLYLTNTLDMEELAQGNLPGMVSLSEESHLAGKVKKETPILIILGNPPYSGVSANISEKIVKLSRKNGKEIEKKVKTWIGELIETYKYVDGQHFGEKKHWLQDDYVKFIRFSQWKIDQAGEGVLGFITNHGYLDNPTFRGMRQSLMKSFQEIYFLDLHGNSLKKEKCPDGSKDENVFDIMQGVVIALFIKKKDCGKTCGVHYAELWGQREKKYDWLENKEKKDTKWRKLDPISPYYFFVPREEKGKRLYEEFVKINDIFPVNVTGIVTARDHFVIDLDETALRNRIMQFRNLNVDDDFIRQSYELKDTRGWKLENARKELAKDENWASYFEKILYRPFDVRHIYYTQKMVDWPRLEIMPNMLKENLGLVMPKRVETKVPWQHILVTKEMVEHVTVSLKTIDYLFPLYIYYDIIKKEPNIHHNIIYLLKKSFRKDPRPEDILFYVYAIFYSTTHRNKYAEFLKIDFPRVPFTKDYKIFSKLTELGEKLVDLHLLKSKELDHPATRFQGKGNGKAEKPKYEKSRVYINAIQYFDGVKPEVWEYQIGGYQVCEKWLKDRKGRTLSLEDIKHYCKIVTALEKTIAIQKDIDKLYPKVEENLLELNAVSKK
jgi:hypothetical protein